MRRLLLIVVVVVAFAATAVAEFTVETVETGDTGYTPEIALDGLSRPGICFANETDDSAKIAHWTGDAWDIDTIDSDGDVGSYCGVFFDGDNEPHVAYRDNGDKFVRYAYRDDDSWTIITLDGTAPTGLGLSVARDSLGWPRTSSVQEDYVEVAYSWMDGGGAYTTYVSDWQTVGGRATGLAVNSGDVSYIAFHETEWNDIWLTRGHDDAWQFLLIDGDETTDQLGTDLALALEGNEFHIAYYNETEGSLYYAAGTWTDFSVELLDGDGDAGSSLDLTLDAAGTPHACYYDAAEDMLRYAYRDTPGWRTYRVADGAGFECSLVVDDSGLVTMTYRDAKPSTLYVARGDASGLPQYGGAIGDDDDDTTGDDDDDATDDDASDDDASDDDATDDDATDDDATDDDTAAGDDDDDDDGGGCAC